MSDSTPRGKKARKTSKEAASQERARVKDEKAEARSLKLQLLADTSQSDDHALREACFNGEDEAAARIIRRQPSLVTEVDEDGLSLLEIALLKANVGCVRLLLENGADPNIAKGGGGGSSSRGDSELNTLDAALRSSREEPEAATALVRLLLEHSADPNYHGCDALKHACLFGPIKCVKLLLDAKGTPDASHVSSVIGKNTADTVRPPPARPPSRPAAAAFPPRRRRRRPPADTATAARSGRRRRPPAAPHRRSLRQRPRRGFDSYAAHARRVPQPAPLHQGAHLERRRPARPPGDDATAQDRSSDAHATAASRCAPRARVDEYDECAGC